MRYILGSSAESLRVALEGRTATIEAEFGSDVVEGSLLTLAHHAGEYQGKPAPCLRLLEGDRPPEGIEVVGLSHVDLDTLGGVLWLEGHVPSNQAERLFWRVAGAVDVQGPHRLEDILAAASADFTSAEVEAAVVRVHAFWAWSQVNRAPRPPRGESVDVTDYIRDAVLTLKRILTGDEQLLEAGREWLRQMEGLETSSFVDEVEDVLVRSSDQFVNHLYRHEGRIYRAVVGCSSRFRTVTISLESPVDGVSAKEIAQSLWGEEAGGHPGIAGSPRSGFASVEEALSEAKRAAEAVAEAFRKAL